MGWALVGGYLSVGAIYSAIAMQHAEGAIALHDPDALKQAFDEAIDSFE